MYEDEKKVVLKLEVPGIEEKDLDVSVENNTLTVKGERKFEKEEKEENFHRIERRYGSFFRAFTLPTTVDTEHVQASYTAGVLKLELTKRPEAQPKQIKVNVGGGSRWKSRSWWERAENRGQGTGAVPLWPGGACAPPGLRSRLATGESGISS